MTTKEKHFDVLKDFTKEELMGMFSNFAIQQHGEDVEIKSAEFGCCPPNSCGSCVNGVCVPCS